MRSSLRGLLRIFLFTALLLAVTPHSFAQADDSSLTSAEIEKVRDTSYNPNQRVFVFIKILDDRAHRIQDLLAKPRHAGRENDLHDLMAQISSIADELDDNLDDYTAKHRDVRKALPKLLDASGSWMTTLQAAPADETYNVARRLALASIRDAHEAAATLGPLQDAFFNAHPDAYKAEQQREAHNPHDVPNGTSPPH